MPTPNYIGLPVYLGIGMVGIYGAGTTTSINGITVVPSRFKFGSIYGIGEGANQCQNELGDIVMFKEDDVTCRLTYSGVVYTIVPQAKLVITEYYP